MYFIMVSSKPNFNASVIIAWPIDTSSTFPHSIKWGKLSKLRSWPALIPSLDCFAKLMHSTILLLHNVRFA